MENVLIETSAPVKMAGLEPPAMKKAKDSKVCESSSTTT